MRHCERDWIHSTHRIKRKWMREVRNGTGRRRSERTKKHRHYLYTLHSPLNPLEWIENHFAWKINGTQIIQNMCYECIAAHSAVLSGTIAYTASNIARQTAHIDMYSTDNTLDSNFRIPRLHSLRFWSDSDVQHPCLAVARSLCVRMMGDGASCRYASPQRKICV